MRRRSKAVFNRSNISRHRPESPASQWRLRRACWRPAVPWCICACTSNPAVTRLSNLSTCARPRKVIADKFRRMPCASRLCNIFWSRCYRIVPCSIIRCATRTASRLKCWFAKIPTAASKIGRRHNRRRNPPRRRIERRWKFRRNCSTKSKNWTGRLPKNKHRLPPAKAFWRRF
ncbi:MAG: hypothetical protein ALAOOOJD_03890 [bacterium]|nr:hypothetical protein [bacterium]